MILHAIHAKPEPKSENGMLEIADGTPFYFGAAIEVRIEFINAYLMGKPIEVQCNIGNGSTIVG